MAFYQSTAGMISLMGVLLPLATATVTLRFIARFKQKIAYGADDFLLLPAWVFLVGLSSLAIYGMVHGFVATTVPKDPNVIMSVIPTFGKVYYTIDLLSVFTVGLTRLSAVFFYRRVFVTANKWDAFGITTFVAIVVLVLYIVGFSLFQVFDCGVQFWEIFDPKPHPDCKTLLVLEGETLTSFILDFLVLIMPIPKIWSLHATVERKLAISIVFVLGAASLAASFVRVVKTYPEFLTLPNRAFVGGPESEDTFLKNTTLLYFILLEAFLCLVAVNLPSLWYFVSGRSPERVLRSIRSMVSLRSGRSIGSKHQHDSEKGSSLTRSDNTSEQLSPTKRDMYEVKVVSVENSN